MLFSEIMGHSQAKTILLNALSKNRVAHAYLFHGPVGVGKKSLARALATNLLCRNSQDDACGHCSICHQIANEQFPDFTVVYPVGNTIKIEQIREVQKRAQFKPYIAAKKVYLIPDAENMTREAANCLLKVLEDPPAETVFLLTAVNPYNLLPTITSRCQLIQLARVPQEEIENSLIQEGGMRPEEARVIATLADGIPGVAKAMLVSDTGQQTREFMFSIDEATENGDLNELLNMAEELEKRKDCQGVLEQLLLWYRDKLIWLETGEERLIINIDKKQNLLDIKDNKEILTRGIADILETVTQISHNANLKLTLEVLLLRLSGAV